MKTTLLSILLSIGLLPALSSTADAQNCQPQSQIYISGYQRCGTPIYMIRYIWGYDRCGRPIWKVRCLSTAELHKMGYLRNRHPHAGYGASRITYSSSAGGYSYRYSSGGPGGCRGW